MHATKFYLVSACVAHVAAGQQSFRAGDDIHLRLAYMSLNMLWDLCRDAATSLAWTCLRKHQLHEQ